MANISFQLVALLLLPALQSRYLTTELAFSHQQETGDETLRSTSRQLHGVSSMMQMTTTTTATGGLSIRTAPQHTLESAASLRNSKDATMEMSNTRAKRSTGLLTSTLATLQDGSGPLSSGVSMEKMTPSSLPFLSDPGETSSIQMVFETSAKPVPQLAELTAVETTNGTTMFNITVSSTTSASSTAILLTHPETERSPVNSITSTTAPTPLTTSRVPTTLTSKEETTRGRITSPDIMHTTSTEGPVVQSTSETPKPHDNLTPTLLSSITTTEITTQPNTSPTTRSLTQQIIKSQTPSHKQQASHNPGITAAIIIAGLLILMGGMILVILLKKQCCQPQKKEDPAWAGPSPFLDGEVQPRLTGVEDDSMAQKPSSKRASLQRFLLQRSDKRQSLLKEEDDQVAMEELQAGSTFGRVQDRESPVGNGTTSTNGATDNPKSPPESMSSPEGNVNLGQDPMMEEATSPVPPLDIPSLSTAPLLDIDLGPPTGEEAPPTPNEAPLVAPPLLPSSEQ
ncbi:protein EVI2B [Scleropages formosus]|uniref:protein EVI2B n=1 Tax=Scleropages formosus TaxID=113540 RepID=UPI000879177B|nr:protein EVI2B [Scleropages formosus]